MPQDVVITSNKSVLNEAFSTFEEVYTSWQRSLELEQILESGTAEDLDAVVEEYSNLQMELIEHKHEELMARAKTILTGLQFSAEWLQKPVSTLSGGWKMRLVLAKLLLQKADFYLFDEPTNHLIFLPKSGF